MERAEQRFEREQDGGGKRSRLLQKLEAGGSRGTAGGSGPTGSSAGGLTDALRQTATRQLATAISGNAALVASIGGSSQAAAVAAALEQQLATGASKSVYQSKLASLVLLIKKAKAAADVPAMAAHIPASAAGDATQPAAGPAAGAGQAVQPAAVSADQLSAQVSEAVRLAGAAGGSAAEAPGAAAAALQALAALPVTVQLLEQTGAGKAIQKLRKHPLAPVAAAAGACVSAWKARVLATTGQ